MDSANFGDKTQNKTVSYDDLVNKDILELMGAQNMTDEEKTKLYREMTETIQGRVIKRVEGLLSDDEIDKFLEYVKANDQEGFSKFAKSKNIEIDQFYAEETLAYKAEMVNLIQRKKEE